MQNDPNTADRLQSRETMLQGLSRDAEVESLARKLCRDEGFDWNHMGGTFDNHCWHEEWRSKARSVPNEQ